MTDVRPIVREPGMEPDQLDQETLLDIRLEVAEQVENARALASLPASAFLRWPWAALSRQTGGMAPGTVSYVCAFSGSGKSTFITSAIDAWLRQGKRIFHMPLETTAEEWRTRWACFRLGINAGDWLGGVAQEWPDWPQMQQAVDAELASQDVERSKKEGLWVDPVEAVTKAGFEDAMAKAKHYRADAVIVDHIDHIGEDEGAADYQEARNVNNAVLRLAKRYGLRVIATSQLNLEAVKGDALAKFMPPRLDHVFMGTAKIFGGIMMLGLYRPIRDRHPDEPVPMKGSGLEDRYVEALRAVKNGSAEPSTVWKPGTMGVVTMKLRNQGKDRHEGQRCELGVEQGRVVEIPERDRYRNGRA
jgi:KaiC/GvpD/RAD55 family RecA-like ATPase